MLISLLLRASLAEGGIFSSLAALTCWVILQRAVELRTSVLGEVGKKKTTLTLVILSLHYGVLELKYLQCQRKTHLIAGSEVKPEL